MASTDSMTFGSYRLDMAENSLWHHDRKIDLQPRPLAVLRYLAERPGQLVTKEELLHEVWSGTHVSKTTLKVCIRNVREALGEVPKAPQYIETVGREGYRFIGAEETQVVAQRLRTARGMWDLMVGREREMDQLERWLTQARDGQRQVVFISGEPGIGKTTLVDQFVERLRSDTESRIGRGQCIEQYGNGEPYRPVLEALEQLGHEHDGSLLVTCLSQYAPTWLIQLPSLVSTDLLSTLQPRVQGATKDRMLREIAEAIEAFTARRELVLVLEDLHWSDVATLDLVSFLAQRRRDAQLLILGTYRPVDIAVNQHPLKRVMQTLQSHRQCQELPLSLLTEDAVGTYLQRLFATDASLDALTQEVYQRTDGNPLFVVNILTYCLQQSFIDEIDGKWQFTGSLVNLGVPDGLRQLIDKQIEGLSEEARRVLEVASVVGTEFAGASVAAGLRTESETVDDICEDLSWKQHFVEEQGIAEWPDETMSGQYGFRHALYQNVLYDRIGEARRVRLHRLVGERLEAAYGERSNELASELALHFERGRDLARAIPYRLAAGQGALRKSAYQEAIDHLNQGLEGLENQPESPQRHALELKLRITLASPLMATKGYAAEELGALFARARELASALGNPPETYPIMYGSWMYYFVGGQYDIAQEVAKEFRRVAEIVNEPGVLLEAHRCSAGTFFFLGDFLAARSHAEKALAYYDPDEHRAHAAMYGHEPGMASGVFLSLALWPLGYPDHARNEVHAALKRVDGMAESHRLSVVVAVGFTTMIDVLRRDWPQVLARTETTIAMCENYYIPIFLAAAYIHRGLAMVMQGQGEEGLAQIHQGFEIQHETDMLSNTGTYYAWLAEAYLYEKRFDDGLSAIDEALRLAETTDERWFEAEMYRIRGELQLGDNWDQSDAVEAEAEQCFHKALDIARRQHARSFELRAAVSLSSLWQQQGKIEAARQLLSPVYHGFTEGFETADLQTAKVLLDALA